MKPCERLKSIRDREMLRAVAVYICSIALTAWIILTVITWVVAE